MRVTPVACLKDNYAYLVICEAQNAAAVVDPSEATPVLSAVQKEGVTLSAIWNTHHHGDHTGGNKGLLDVHPELAVVAHASDRGRIPGQTTFVEEGNSVSVGDQVTADVIHNPGHTSGAISFYLREPGIVFTGDTLFGAGCGRLFEGSPEDMYKSLAKLSNLPKATKVYCGHEYTEANLRFAAAVEPANEKISTRQKQVAALRQATTPSVPFTIEDERATNPFLRAHIPEVLAGTRANEQPRDESPVQVFAALRRWKDRF